METGSGEVGIAVTVPSCACCSARIEEEVGDALGLPRGTLKFVVPVTARFFYDPQVVELGEIVESLKRRGCTIPVERVRYGIPLRPLFLPDVWKARVERLGKELQGVLLASIDFVRSMIVVDYVPALVRPHEILDALMGEGNRHLESRKLGIKGDESIHMLRANPDPEPIRTGYSGSLFSLGAGFSRHCHNNDLESMSAQV